MNKVSWAYDGSKMESLLDDLEGVAYKIGFCKDVIEDHLITSELRDKTNSCIEDGYKIREEIRESIMAYFKEKRYED